MNNIERFLDYIYFDGLMRENKRFSNALLSFYELNTNHPKNTFIDSGRKSIQVNPIAADRLGAFPLIYLKEPANYRIRMYDQNGIMLFEMAADNHE